jgi:hypothetical protein
MSTLIPLIILDHIKDGNKPQSKYDLNSYFTGFVQSNCEADVVSTNEQ